MKKSASVGVAARVRKCGSRNKTNCGSQQSVKWDSVLETSREYIFQKKEELTEIRYTSFYGKQVVDGRLTIRLYRCQSSPLRKVHIS